MGELTWARRFMGSAGFDVGIVLVLLLYPSVGIVLGLQPVYAVDVVLLAPLVLRRTRPVATFTIVCLMLAVQAVALDYPRYGDITLLFALYAVAAYGPTWAAWWGLAAGLLGAAVATLRWGGDFRIDPAGLAVSGSLLVAVTFAAWLLGFQARTRRAYVAGLEDRAAQLERDATQQAQIATAAERARIAREMHDVVAHSLSVMVVQADGALYASQRRPEQAVDTLRTISATGRSSLAEMRKLLGLLREDDHTAELAPLPGGRDVVTLVEQVRASGLSVELDVAGDLDGLDPATGLTVYRIVQEALTNTLRHAGPGVSATVEVAVTPAGVRVEIDDDGRGVAPGAQEQDGLGHGIRGIRERIAVHAGDIDAGPRPGGGFRVRATVPLTVPGPA